MLRKVKNWKVFMKLIVLLLAICLNSFAGTDAKIKKNMDYIADNMYRYSGYNTARHERLDHLARQNDQDQCMLDLKIRYIRYSEDGTQIITAPSYVYVQVDMRKVEKSGLRVVRGLDYDHGAETHQVFIKSKEGTSFPVLMYKMNDGDRLNWNFYEEDYLTSTYFDETYLVTRYKYKKVVKALKKLINLCRKR